MNGVCAVTSDKTWLPKKGLFVKNGFELVDAVPDHELYAKRFNADTLLPKFNRVLEGKLDKFKGGLTVFKSDQCPYSSASVRHIKEFAKETGLPLRVERIENCQQAQNMVHPYGTFSVLHKGKIVTYRPIGKENLQKSLSKA